MKTAPNPTTIPPFWWREVLDFVLLSLLVLYLIRFYCLEFFLIPSQSMFPTLHGDPVSGDRILVNRTVYELAGWTPQRWDVAVFKYPLDLSQNFVKRVVGLPQEQLQIRSSDIWIQGKIPSKPEELQERFWSENMEEKPFIQRFQESFTTDPAEVFVPTPQGNFELILPEGFSDWVKIQYLPTQSFLYDEDTRLRLLFQPQGEEGQLQFILGESQERYIVLLGEDSSFSHWQGHQLQATLHLPFHWVKGQVYGIEFVSLDQKVFCRVNGRDLIFSQEGGKEVPYYRSSSIQADSFSFRILELAFQNLEGKLLDIRVAYDLRYTSSMDYVLDWHLGEEEYFVCGDHSSKSNDSRVWQKTFIQVQEEQGWREYQGQIEEQTDSVDFFDCFGRHRRYPYSELRIGKTVPAPVVPARYFLGKAWCIWWPPQRIQLIR